MRKVFIVGILVVLLILAGFIFLRRSGAVGSHPLIGIFLGGGGQTYTPAPPPEAANYAAGNYSESIVTADGRTRTYILTVPTGYSSSKSYPLVLLFHGGYGTAQQILKQTNFGAKADSEGFILVAPDGIDKHWSDGSRPQVADDVAFTQELISRLSSTLSINKKKIYATGLSNGAQMSNLLGCRLSNVFAAIAPVAGEISEALYATCAPSPIAVVGIQGAADPLQPIEGGQGKGDGGPHVSAIESMQKWASISGCNSTPTITHIPPTVDDGTSVDKYTFSGCKKDVVYYIVQGMGHGWPPTPPASVRISGKTSKNINATDVIWDFFSTHSR